MKYILVLLADWANGLFAVLLASWWLGVEPVWWHFLIGVLFAHSPDVDAIPELLRRGKVTATGDGNSGDHRDGLHYPVLWVLLGTGLAWLIGFWGYVFLFATTLHFVNDFYGTGWGVKVLWPFSKTQYKLLGRRANRLKYLLQESYDWNRLSDSERRLRLLVAWTPTEIEQYQKQWGIEDWIEPYYVKINWVSGIEYMLFVIALTGTVLTLVY